MKGQEQPFSQAVGMVFISLGFPAPSQKVGTAGRKRTDLDKQARKRS